MSDLIATVISLTVGVAFAVAIARRVSSNERAPIYIGYSMHVAFGLLNVVLTYYYYGGGDMTSYIRHAVGMSDVIRQDPGTWAWPYFKHAFLPFSERLPYTAPGSHGPTQAVFVFVAFHQVLFGKTIYGINFFVGAFSFLSKGAVYLVFRELFPARYRQRIAFGILALPSTALWSGSLMKEGLVWMTVGWVLWGYYQAMHKGRRSVGFPVMVLAAIPVAMIKAYVLFPMVIGFAIWTYWKSVSRQRRVQQSSARPLILLIRAALVFSLMTAGLLGLGRLFPRYDVANLTDEAAEMQEIGSTVEGGSNFNLAANSGFVGQLAAAPVAMFTAIYRPLLVEARSPVAAANSLETTLLLLLTLWVIQKRGLRLIGLIRGSPPLMFCLIYITLFSVAVGLTTTNLGTLSRYRMPMMPYLGVMMAVLVPMRVKAAETPRVVRKRRRPRGGAQVVSLRERRTEMSAP